MTEGAGADPREWTRERWPESIRFGGTYSAEVFSNLRGGAARGAGYHDNLDLTLDVDANVLWGWRGATLHLYALSNRGSRPSEFVGDAQGTSNIEAPGALKLYEAWLQQEFDDGRISFLLGLYDLNSEFDVIETGGFFLNSSHGIGPDFSQSGLNGPSIFPYTSLAFRGKLQAGDSTYFQGAIFDGVPGDPDGSGGLHLIPRRRDGILFAAEAGRLTGEVDDPTGKLAMGVWFYSGLFDHPSESCQEVEDRAGGNRGFYVLAENTLLREAPGSGQGLKGFARVGWANSHLNRFGLYVGAGLVYTGLIPGRDLDQVGLAMAMARNGNCFMADRIHAGAVPDRQEVNLEFSYRWQASPWLAIQPDLQIVFNPDTDQSLGNAVVAASRFEITF